MKFGIGPFLFVERRRNNILDSCSSPRLPTKGTDGFDLASETLVHGSESREIFKFQIGRKRVFSFMSTTRGRKTVKLLFYCVQSERLTADGKPKKKKKLIKWPVSLRILLPLKKKHLFFKNARYRIQFVLNRTGKNVGKFRVYFSRCFRWYNITENTFSRLKSIKLNVFYFHTVMKNGITERCGEYLGCFLFAESGRWKMHTFIPCKNWCPVLRRARIENNSRNIYIRTDVYDKRSCQSRARKIIT